MSSDYTYDAEGNLWPFFAFTVTSIATLPLTYVLTKSWFSDPSKQFPRIQSDYKPKHADIINAQRAKHSKQSRRPVLTLFVLIGWAIMVYTAYLIYYVEVPVEKRIWNPYDILGISESATEKVIKRTYKKLSLKFHPDKIRPDASKNETVESLNARYVDISKAYQALTDEEVRNNYMLYGHPDGRQSTQIGIALPKLMISDGNGKYVVLIYFLLFGVLLPYLVGSWWYGTQARSKEGVLLESANSLFKEYKQDIDVGGVITALSTGKEFSAVLNGDKADAGLSKIESRILAPGEVQTFAGGLSVKDKEKLEDLDNGVRRKTLALLWAYLGRVELDDATLEKQKFEVAAIAESLMKSLNAITTAYQITGPMLAGFQAGQRIIQALAPEASPLLQLPHITPAIAKAIDGDSKIPTTVQRLMDQPEAKRHKLAVGPGLLTEQQYQTAVNVAKQLPYFRVAKAFFKVQGERFIIPSSLVQLVVKGRVIPPGSENIPEVNELDLDDVDPAEDDLDAILGRKKRTVKGVDGKTVTVADDQPVVPPLAFAPHFAREHSPRWHVFLSDSKQGKMAVPPFTFHAFDQPIFEADGKTPTYNMVMFKAQFAAPPNPGHYTFVMHVVCDSYVGFDTKMEVTLVVEDAAKAAKMQEEDEISEPDEDSIAGIMNAAKGNAPPPPKRKQAAAKNDDSEEESGTEEEEDDTSATNTDTDGED
ncbi:translocation protein sec63 [Coniella lustricola]|uniref:Translocation protein sec63 n=1 Tax=Coniella lustricola TaxID=2025994 RepID=A0A2T3AEP0_9PEZI|nr:translocation protein sec63 [Coniella lustricola]